MPASVICNSAPSVNVPAGPRYAMLATIKTLSGRRSCALRSLLVKLGLPHLLGRSTMTLAHCPAPTTAERIRSTCVRAGGALLAVDSAEPLTTRLHHLLADGSFAVGVPIGGPAGAQGVDFGAPGGPAGPGLAGSAPAAPRA